MLQPEYPKVSILQPLSSTIDTSEKVLKLPLLHMLSEAAYRKLLKQLDPQKFSYHALMELLNLDRSIMAEIFGQGETTFWRVLNNKAQLDKNAYYRLKQLLDIIFLGIEVYDYIVGDFIQWFHTPIQQHKDQTPLEIFINEPLGHQILKDTLLRVEHNIFL